MISPMTEQFSISASGAGIISFQLFIYLFTYYHYHHYDYLILLGYKWNESGGRCVLSSTTTITTTITTITTTTTTTTIIVYQASFSSSTSLSHKSREGRRCTQYVLNTCMYSSPISTCRRKKALRNLFHLGVYDN